MSFPSDLKTNSKSDGITEDKIENFIASTRYYELHKIKSAKSCTSTVFAGLVSNAKHVFVNMGLQLHVLLQNEAAWKDDAGTNASLARIHTDHNVP